MLSNGAAGPILDGTLITQGTDTAFDKKLEMQIPYMLGGNSNEASLFPTRDPAARMARLPGAAAIYNPNNSLDAAHTVNLIVTDAFIGQPDRLLARDHTKNGSPVYRYFFSYVSPNQRASGNGLGHGGEIAYVFGRGNDPQDLATSEEAQAYWTAFAKYGSPGAAGGVLWPKYDLKDEPVMEFSANGLAVRNHLFDASQK